MVKKEDKEIPREPSLSEYRARKYYETLEEEEARRRYRQHGGGLLPVQVKVWIVKFLGWTFVILLILGLIIFPFTDIGNAALSKIGISIGPLGSKLLAFGQTKAAEIESQITGVGEWKNPEATEVTRKKGVEIKRIVSTQDNFLPKDEIEIIGEGIAYALEDKETIVKFGCYIDGDNDGIWIGHMLTSDNDLTVRAGRDENFAISCNLGKYGSDFYTDVEYPKVKFVALYNDFSTKGNLRLYTMKKEELKSLGTIDPFKKYNVKDNLLDLSSGTTRSSYEYGPLKLSMAVSNRQPFTEDKTYVLKVNIAPDEVYWAGELIEGKFKLLVPEEIKFAGDPRSKICTQTLILKNNNLNLFCDFSLVDIEEGLSYSRINAQITYDFEFSKQDTVIIAKEGISDEEIARLSVQTVKTEEKEA